MREIVTTRLLMNYTKKKLLEFAISKEREPFAKIAHLKCGKALGVIKSVVEKAFESKSLSRSV